MHCGKVFYREEVGLNEENLDGNMFDFLFHLSFVGSKRGIIFLI